MEEKKGDMVVEQGAYQLIATTDPSFEITHLVLSSADGATKRVWRVQQLTEKEVSFKIEKFN